nr:hypothetical protein Iba_chr13fCG11990 [Ipomoea batatas]
MTRSLADFAAMVAWSGSVVQIWAVLVEDDENLDGIHPLRLLLVQQGCDDILKLESEPRNCSSSADDSVNRTGTLWFIKPVPLSVLAGFSAEKNGNFNGEKETCNTEEAVTISFLAMIIVGKKTLGYSNSLAWQLRRLRIDTNESKKISFSTFYCFSRGHAINPKRRKQRATARCLQDRIQDSVQYRGFFVYAGCLISTLAVFLGIRDDPTRILAGQSGDLQPWRRRLPVARLRNRSEPHQNQFSSLRFSAFLSPF